MIVHFFKERVKQRVDFGQLIDGYFDNLKNCRITSNDDEVVLEMSIKEFDFKYYFKITKRTAILSMYKLNSAYINTNLLVEIPCMIPQYLSRLILKQVSEICEKFEFFIYFDKLEDIHSFEMFELISALSKERQVYLDNNQDVIAHSLPMNTLNDMCHYQKMTSDLPNMVKNDVVANKYVMLVDKNTQNVYASVVWKQATPAIFPPYLNFVQVEEEENVVVLIPIETFYKYTEKLMYEIKDDGIDFKILYLNNKGAIKAYKLLKKMRKSIVSLTNYETIKLTDLIEK